MKGSAPIMPTMLAGPLHGRCGQRRHVTQRGDPAPIQPRTNVARILIRLYQRHAEFQSLLARHFSRELRDGLQMRLGASSAARSDYNGDASRHNSEKHKSQIALHGFARVKELTGSQIKRATDLLSSTGVCRDSNRVYITPLTDRLRTFNSRSKPVPHNFCRMLPERRCR